jgi:hypothetical protein
MCGGPLFQSLLSYLEQNCPFVGTNIADPTGIVRNEGKMQGWFGLTSELRAIHISKPPPPPPVDPNRPIYPDPDKPQERINQPRPKK